MKTKDDFEMGAKCRASLVRYVQETIADGYDNEGNERTEPVKVGEEVGIDLVCFCEEEGYQGSSELRGVRFLTAVVLESGFRFIH